uniref:3'-5' exoribonuclease Rv2179c-like domain-containing protein n=1 Tax=viral metagenome TaxID=1070528 RepID=A0A6C0LY42_9ZZZZ
MTDVMIDIETLGTSPTSVVMTIGAIRFSRRDPTPGHPLKLTKMDSFYRRVDRDSCRSVGMTEDASTIEWWGKQTPEAKAECFSPESRFTIHEALTHLTKWIRLHDTANVKMWANGSSFDCVILTEAYRMCGMKTPWEYWNIRDLRTVLDLAGMRSSDIPSYGSKHHALWDCYNQILVLRRALDIISSSKI